MSYARFSPTRIASYSAWLLVALNPNWRAYSKRRSSGPSMTTPAPQTVLFEKPSTYIIPEWRKVSKKPILQQKILAQARMR